MNESQIGESFRKTENASKLSRNSEFLSLWFVGGILNILRWLELLAVGIVVFDMTASPFYVALMVTLRFFTNAFPRLPIRCNSRAYKPTVRTHYHIILNGFRLLFLWS